jgi:NADH-quinone oxidoreductase subunit N
MALDFTPIWPVTLAGLGAMAVLMLEVFLSRRATSAWIGSALMWTAVAFLAAAGVAGVVGFAAGEVSVFPASRPMIRLDPLAGFAIGLVALGSALSCLLSVVYLRVLRIEHGEYYALVLLASSGMILLVQATDLIAVFLGIELMSIPLYVLAGFDRRRLRSNESALKYFLVGSFASAILLYGMALLYGATGHTDYAGLRAGLDLGNPLCAIGLGLLLVGFAFKIAVVPFHQWTPDVYEGAPTSVTAYMSVTVKVAAFAALLRLLESLASDVSALLAALAALTLVVGNVMAIVQQNVKRLLAYSSVAHAGYALLGLVAASDEGQAALLFYLLAYVFMNLGAFAVIVTLARDGQDLDRMTDFAGLARTRPVLAALMTLFMISLAGIPGTVGFMAKFMIFAAAVHAGWVGLVVLAVVTSVISVYYYLRLPVLMYMSEPAEAPSRADEVSTGESLVLGACAVAVVLFGIFPNSWLPSLDWARASVATLF